MKEYINNLNLYEPIRKTGNEFSYTINLSGLQGGTISGGTANIPLFASSMFNNLYSDVTENIAVSRSGTGSAFGLCAYGGDIWGGTVIDGFLNTQVMYPYNGLANVTNANLVSNFFFTFGTADTTNPGANGFWGVVGLQSSNMQYQNLLNRLTVEKLLCTNINIKVYSTAQNFSINNLPLYFFTQDIDSRIFSTETSIGRYVNPQTNASTSANITAGTAKSTTQVDIPVSWVFDYKSGMTIPFPYSLLSAGLPLPQLIGYQISYTFKKIIL